jgi:membrane protein implicated in regulation of membrane protease activity
MTAPYGRILVLHIAIIAGGFLVSSLGSPLGLLLALVALKIGMDIMLHRRSHRRSARRTAAAANDSTAPPRQDTGTGEN